MKSLRRCVSVWTLAIGLAAGPLLISSDAHWPQWRGPNRDDISPDKGLLTKWPSGGPALVWKATGLGGGYSGVSIAGGRIFTMGETAEATYLIALQLSDGKKLWSLRVGKAGAPGWGSFAGPRSTPTLDGERVFALGHYGEMVCAEAASGKEVWRKHYMDDFGGHLPEWGFSESLLVDGDRVVGTPGGAQGTVIALDKATGETVWRCGDLKDDAHYSSLIKIEIGDVPQYVVLTAESVAGIAAKDGQLLWRAERKGKVAVIPTPVHHEGHIYVTSGYNVGCSLLRIEKSDAGFSATEVYANREMVNHHGGAVLVGKHVYGHSESRGWICQDVETGEVVWKDRSLGKGSLTFADGHLYLREEAGPGTIVLVEATPDGYKEKSRFEQPDRSKKNSWPHPVVAGGQLFIRDQDILLCYRVKAES
ncbi:MAG: PQQ-like beta-propeller repeat protein [Planctomycetes bacterium]|nr:PQQ-like beta-propeller repeat protein [Planctomycetota bacterium]